MERKLSGSFGFILTGGYLEANECHLEGEQFDLICGRLLMDLNFGRFRDLEETLISSNFYTDCECGITF